MLNEKFTFCFKVTIKWHLTKSLATKLKSAKYKTHVIKKTNFKMIEQQQNESISWLIIL